MVADKGSTRRGLERKVRIVPTFRKRKSGAAPREGKPKANRRCPNDGASRRPAQLLGGEANWWSAPTLNGRQRRNTRGHEILNGNWSMWGRQLSRSCANRVRAAAAERPRGRPSFFSSQGK